MKRILIISLIIIIFCLAACKKQSENEQYYFRGVKAERSMNYEGAIAHYAKALTFNRQDAISWFAKGRCHLLLAMSENFLLTNEEIKISRIKSNLSKADDCFRRAQQWGYRTTAESDTLYKKLQKKFY